MMDSPNITNEGANEVINNAVPERENKKSSRKSKSDKSSRKKDERSLEVILKGLNNVADSEEKIQILSKKYGELYEENKKETAVARATEKQIMMLKKEKMTLTLDQSKSVMKGSKLEELCRELQRQNKAMKEESTQRAREEEEKRKEVSSKFHATLSEITALMQQNTESNAKLRDENLEMQKQLKTVWEQYGLREQQAEKMTKQIKLEGQLAEAKITKAKLEFEAQRELLERDKAELGSQLALCQSRCIGHEKTEEALRAQINVYYEKYDEFQNVLTKSNSVYSGFKSEMEKMSKKITKLEKETSSWKQKWESTHKALLALAAEKQVKDEEVDLQARQLEKMQKLCRTLLLEKASREKESGRKSEEIVPDSALVEDTIAAHMAVSDFVRAKTTLPAEVPVLKAKDKKPTQKKAERAKIQKPVETVQQQNSNHTDKGNIDNKKKEVTAIQLDEKQTIENISKEMPLKTSPKKDIDIESQNLSDNNLKTNTETVELISPKPEEQNDVQEKSEAIFSPNQDLLKLDEPAPKFEGENPQVVKTPQEQGEENLNNPINVENVDSSISQNGTDLKVENVPQDTVESKNDITDNKTISADVSTAAQSKSQENSIEVAAVATITQEPHNICLTNIDPASITTKPEIVSESLLNDVRKSEAIADIVVPCLDEKSEIVENGSIQLNDSSPKLVNEQSKVPNKQSRLPCLQPKEKTSNVSNSNSKNCTEKSNVAEIDSSAGGGDAASPSNEEQKDASSTIPNHSPEQRSTTSPANKSANDNKKSKDGRRRSKKK